MNPVFDTNIVIDFLRGEPKAARELELYEQRRISIISWMEVMVGCSDEQQDQVKQWLAELFAMIPIHQEIAQRAVAVRQERQLKLPDAIIFATALECDTLLVTRNIKDFPKSHPSVREPYTLT